LRRGDDFVTRADAQGQQGDMQGAGGRAERHGMGSADPFGKALLEFLALGTCGDPARAQDLLDCGDFFSTQARA
jgi:hypothetical protein